MGGVIASWLSRMVIPETMRMLKDFGVHYSPVVVGMNAASLAWASAEGFVVAGLIALVLFGLLLQLSALSSLRERVARSIPIFSRVYWSSVLARFSQTSALAAASGAPLPDMLVASAQASGSAALKRAAGKVATQLRDGVALQDACATVRDIPSLWVGIVSVAGPRGDLPAALSELARLHEAQAHNTAGIVRILLGPLLLIMVGLMLSSVMFVLMAPIISLLRALT